MQLILTNPNNDRKWRLRPYKSGQCLTIERQPLGEVARSGLEVKSEFVPIDHYPSTWEQGIRSMLRLLMMDTEDTEIIEVSDLEYVPDEVAAAFDRKLSEIEIEVRK